MQASFSFIQHMVILEICGSVLGLVVTSGSQEKSTIFDGQQQQDKVTVVVVVIYFKWVYNVALKCIQGFA